jgi:hypothetical protein
MDKDGNRVEVDGPLTPITPPFNINSQFKHSAQPVTPTKDLNNNQYSKPVIGTLSQPSYAGNNQN